MTVLLTNEFGALDDIGHPALGCAHGPHCLGVEHAGGLKVVVLLVHLQGHF